MKNRSSLKRKLLIFSLLLVALPLAGVLAHAIFGKRLRVENVDQIHKGMSLAEVEKLLGGPPGNYGLHIDLGAESTREEYVPPGGSNAMIWTDANHQLYIYFDGQGRVSGFHSRAGFHQISPLDILRDLLNF